MKIVEYLVEIHAQTFVHQCVQVVQSGLLGCLCQRKSLYWIFRQLLYRKSLFEHLIKWPTMKINRN